MHAPHRFAPAIDQTGTGLRTRTGFWPGAVLFGVNAAAEVCTVGVFSSGRRFGVASRRCCGSFEGGDVMGSCRCRGFVLLDGGSLVLL